MALFSAFIDVAAPWNGAIGDEVLPGVQPVDVPVALAPGTVDKVGPAQPVPQALGVDVAATGDSDEEVADVLVDDAFVEVAQPVLPTGDAVAVTLLVVLVVFVVQSAH